MSVRYSAGKATAYGAAVQAGYTGTYEEFCEEQARFAENAQQVAEDAAQVAADKTAVEAAAQQVAEDAETFMETTVPGAVAAIRQVGAAQIDAMQQEGSAQLADIAQEGEEQVSAVETAGATQVTAVESAGTTQTGNVNAAGENQVAAVNAAGETKVAAVNDAGTTQTGNVNSAGATQTEAVNQAGATQVQAVEDAGAAALAGINAAIDARIDDTLTEAGNAADAKKTGDEITALKEDLQKYDDLCRIIKISDTSTTLGDIATILNNVNTVGDHVFFDMSALGVMMYLCTIYIDTANHVYKVFDLVSGRYAEGVYTDDMLLTMATAQANNLAVQSQIDTLQNEIDELGGKSVIKNWDTLGDLIAAGTSTDVISPGDTTELNWIASVLGTTTSGLTVNCTDMDKYIGGVGEAEEPDYLFVYDGAAWTYNGEQVALSDFGLTVSGTPLSGEVMTIKTTVNPVSYTFVGYDDFTASDENVPHNWCLEQTYAPDTRVYNTYESLFCIQAGKSVPAGKWYLPMRSYRSGKIFNVCFELASAVGGSSKVQMRSTGYDYATFPDVSGTDVTGVYKPKALAPILYGTTTSTGATATITILSDADVTAGGYTNIESLNTAANDPVVVIGDFDKSALGNNCWIVSNIREWLHDDTLGDSYVPPYDNNIASAYNRGRGFLWGLDPRVRALMQYADVYWLSGYGNHDIESYQRATGTAPSANAPTYYERSGEPGNRVYTALDPQPTAGADVSGYYVRVTTYTNGTIYISEDKVFLLSMKEMGFNIQTGEGNLTDLYGEYCGGELTNGDVADRAKYNKAGGTLNSYRWSRSGISGYAISSWYVSSTGGNGSNGANSGYFVAPAIIIGKSA